MDNIKKIVNKYNKITNEIDNCKKNLDIIIANMNDNEENTSESSESSEEMEIDNINKNIEELEIIKDNINQNIDTIGLEELINVFYVANNIITKTKKCLEQQKLEIKNIE